MNRFCHQWLPVTNGHHQMGVSSHKILCQELGAFACSCCLFFGLYDFIFFFGNWNACSFLMRLGNWFGQLRISPLFALKISWVRFAALDWIWTKRTALHTVIIHLATPIISKPQWHSSMGSHSCQCQNTVPTMMT